MKNYLKKCPNCGKDLIVDDIDYNFEGCQDEYLICTNCAVSLFVKVRYGKVLKNYQLTILDEETLDCYKKMEETNNGVRN